MVLDAMPDSVDVLVLSPNGLGLYLSDEQATRLARMPTTQSSLRGTVLGNLRSLSFAVAFSPHLLNALEYGCPLLEKLELHVSMWGPWRDHTQEDKVTLIRCMSDRFADGNCMATRIHIFQRGIASHSGSLGACSKT
jgi:hypothetical protein